MKGIILGTDFLSAYNATLDFKGKCVVLNGQRVPVKRNKGEGKGVYSVRVQLVAEDYGLESNVRVLAHLSYEGGERGGPRALAAS